MISPPAFLSICLFLFCEALCLNTLSSIFGVHVLFVRATHTSSWNLEGDQNNMLKDFVLMYQYHAFQVDGQFRTNIPGIFAVGDVAAFPLKVHC